MSNTASQPLLGLGVVGLHEGTTMLVAASTRTTHIRAVAGCDTNPDKIASARTRCPQVWFTDDYAAMLDRDDVDVVSIFTPDELHGRQIVQAFEAGKHVICTKPIVNTIEDAQRVLQASKTTGRRLLVGQSTRFFESFACQRADFEQGAVGELELVDAHYTHRMDWFYDKSPWAVNTTDWVFLGLSHPVDLIRWYLGPIASVHALGTRTALARRYGVAGFDLYTVNFTAADGRIGRCMGNYGLHELPRARNAIELMLYGSAGSSLAQYHDMRYLCTKPDGTECLQDMLYAKREYYFNNEVHGMHYGEFANYADSFARGILADHPCSPELEEGIETFIVMEAIRQSAADGGRVIEIAPLLKQIF
ncbi:MAG: gfo/Idh/MocA family oxidoreductase [Planctomycetes bacterium]|nr:gfo/Idh/MocA family oxidoreductase [Planctomycetota bacterium]NOG54391.1 Gfo/Idh/MocA family oxidoreductase [Planctomycetota bacterium]